MREEKICSVSGCGREFYCKGLCSRHYKNAQYAANPEKFRLRQKEMRRREPEKFKAIDAERRKANPTKSADWYAANKEKAKRDYSIWRLNNKEKARGYDAARDPATERARAAIYRAANPEKGRIAAAAWAKANPGRVNAINMRRYASKMNATPAWANKVAIEEIYDLAQLRTKILGVPHEVDHIVPLQSKLVCGLHVEHNLRVIPMVENVRKGNRWWPDMPGA